MKQADDVAKFSFENKMSLYIDENSLIDKGDRVLVALSGGSDSVCLLKALYELREKYAVYIMACHVNHMIRGGEAERDEMFCKKLCASLEIPLEVGRFDVPEIAKREKKSTELAAREVRYKFFDELLKKHNIDKIATAHNKNDNAETLVMNYIRGSGLSGLCGIDAMRDNIIRPLLCMEKSEILSYLYACGAAYVTDSTNLSLEYTRNKVRHTLIPDIEKNFNPNFVNTITADSDIIREDNAFIEETAEKAGGICIARDRGEVYIKLEKLKSYHKAIRFRVIRKAISMAKGDVLDIGSDTVKRIDRLKQGRISICKDLFAAAYGERLCFEGERVKQAYEYELSLGESIYIKEDNSYIYSEIVPIGELKKKKNCVWFDLGEAKKLTVRSRRDGDIIKTEGGTKKLKKLFIDEKIPTRRREVIPIIEYENKILWIASLRRSSEHKINEYTKKAIKIKYVRGETNEDA